MNGLTHKQDRFAREYAKHGNGTRSAIVAGYTKDNENVAAAIASQNLRKVKVAKAIQRLRARTAERLDISREKMLNDAAHIAEQATADGDYGPANKAIELIMRAQGYITDRSINLNVDMTASHLQALQSILDGTAEKALEAARSHNAGDNATPVDAELIDDVHLEQR